MLEASNFSVSNDLEYTYYDKSHPILVFAMTWNTLTAIKVIRFIEILWTQFQLTMVWGIYLT